MFWKVFRLAPLSGAVYPFLMPISWLVTLIEWGGGVGDNIRGYDPNAKGFKLWWQRVCWIRRNPGGRFNVFVLGYPSDGSAMILESGVGYPRISTGARGR